MKKLIITLCLFVAGSAALADTYVNGYYRSNGTYVKPHYRTYSDGYTYNNYSYRGNYNPHTGNYGTKSYSNSYGSSYNYYNPTPNRNRYYYNY